MIIMDIDWVGVLIALLVSFLAFFVLVKLTDSIGFCLDHNISSGSPSSACIAKADDVVALAPKALSIALLRSLIIPIIAFSLGILFYFKGHHIENWHDTLFPAFAIGSLSGIATLIVLYLFQPDALLDFLYLFTVLSWIGFFIGVAVFCAVIGGMIVYLSHKKE